MENIIRKDILAIDLIPLSPIGQCNLMSFDEETIKYSLAALQRKLMKEDLEVESRWRYFVVVCNNFSKDNKRQRSFTEALRLIEQKGLNKNADSFDRNAELKVVSKINKSEKKESSPTLQWEDSPEFREANFANAFLSEELRVPGDKKMNKFWGMLYASQKKQLFDAFPYLKEIHDRDWIFCKDLIVFTGLINKPEMTSKDHAENILIANKSIKDPAKKLPTKLNPWWNKLSDKERDELNATYPCDNGIELPKDSVYTALEVLAKQMGNKKHLDEEFYNKFDQRISRLDNQTVDIDMDGV